MKNIILIVFVALTISAKSQSKPYVTSGGELIFSFASIDDNGRDESSALRFAPIINLQSMLNKDMSPKFGVFTGLAVRNVGYIYKNYTFNGVTNEKRFRSYNLALPVGIKIGNLDKLFLYGGYEVELPFLYKEKTYSGGDKTNKITGWFSNREEQFQHGFLVGIQFPYGMNLKFKYYLSEFHNQGFTEANGDKPYAGLHSQVFYFSLSAYLFKNLELVK